jgi:DNA-binding transcriptional MerR regulator
MSEPDPATGVYTISVAAELAGVTIRSLRLYERRGLLAPARTTGGTRRFSQHDLHRLRRIGELVADGVNLTGIGKILDLERDTRQLRGDNTALRADNTRLRDQHEKSGHTERSVQDKEPAGRRSSSRRAPTDAHRDQPSRPG